MRFGFAFENITDIGNITDKCNYYCNDTKHIFIIHETIISATTAIDPLNKLRNAT